MFRLRQHHQTVLHLRRSGTVQQVHCHTGATNLGTGQRLCHITASLLLRLLAGKQADVRPEIQTRQQRNVPAIGTHHNTQRGRTFREHQQLLRVAGNLLRRATEHHRQQVNLWRCPLRQQLLKRRDHHHQMHRGIKVLNKMCHPCLKQGYRGNNG
ncbi:hypothetical protein D3C81_1492290 [compost metagenome]